MNKELNLDLLKEILLSPGISGDEKQVVELLKEKLTPYVTSLETNAMGNLIAYKKGSSHCDIRLMLSAHIDEIGLVIRYIDPSGLIRVLPVGGIDPRTLLCQEFLILGSEPIPGIVGTKPVHIQKSEDKKTEIKLEDLLIDTGFTKEELEQKGVTIGSSIVRVGGLKELGPLLSSKSMDNRVCVFILVELLKQLKECPYDLYCVFCTQEEVGLRGIRTATATIRPHIGINLDVGLANDLPGVPEHDVGLKLGKGTAINLINGTSLSHRNFFRKIIDIANANDLPFQVDIGIKGGTDAAGIQYLALVDCVVCGISLPLRYMHSPVETVHVKDISDTIKLMKAIVSYASLKDLVN